jgi:O-antigen ligase
MTNKLKQIFSSFKPIDFAILINAIGLNFMKFVPFGLIILVLASLYELLITKTASFNLNNRFSKKSLFVLTIPFSLAILGLIFTTNYGKAFEDIGRLLPFILLPVLLICVSGERKEKLNKLVLLGFIVGLLIRFALDFYESAQGYFHDYNIQIFFYSYLDADTNILAIITMFGVLYLLDFLTSTSRISVKKNVIIHCLILFLSLYILLLQSRIVIVFFFTGLVLLFLLKWKKNRKWSILITAVFSGLLMLIPSFQGRFQVVAAESQKINTTIEVSASDTIPIENLPCMSSTQLRYNSLKTSWKIAKKNPIFGVGTGDWRDELVKEYIDSDMPCNAHEKTAPHNQYMRTLLKYGFVGLLIYFGYIFQLFKVYRKRFRFGQLPFLITLIFCGLGYDLIDVGSSAPFFAFFSTWLFFEDDK